MYRCKTRRRSSRIIPARFLCAHPTLNRACFSRMITLYVLSFKCCLHILEVPLRSHARGNVARYLGSGIHSLLYCCNIPSTVVLQPQVVTTKETRLLIMLLAGTCMRYDCTGNSKYKSIFHCSKRISQPFGAVNIFPIAGSHLQCL